MKDMEEKKEMVNHAGMWKPIREFPLYEISSDGRVRRVGENKVRKISIGKRGYPVLSLRKDGKTYVRTLHRLLADAFIPNPNNLPEINHIDGNKTNFSLSNLEWCTRKHNDNHARRTGLHKSDGDKAVVQYSLSGVPIAEYKSASEAARKTGASRSAIANVCNRRKNQKGYEHKTNHGYIWRWKEE